MSHEVSITSLYLLPLPWDQHPLKEKVAPKFSDKSKHAMLPKPEIYRIHSYQKEKNKIKLGGGGLWGRRE